MRKNQELMYVFIAVMLIGGFLNSSPVVFFLKSQLLK